MCVHTEDNIGSTIVILIKYIAEIYRYTFLVDSFVLLAIPCIVSRSPLCLPIYPPFVDVTTFFFAGNILNQKFNTVNGNNDTQTNMRQQLTMGNVE